MGIVVVGGAVTVTVTVAVLLSATPSLALYVNVWIPAAAGVYMTRAVSLFGLPGTQASFATAPSVPLDGGCTTENVSSQLSTSVAPMRTVTPVPTTAVTLLFAAIGAVFEGTGLTAIVMDADPERPPESVTDAVMVCEPTVSALVEKVPPEPIAPSRLDTHERLAVRLPSSVSVAVPVKATGCPTVLLEPLPGAVIVTTGA